MGANLLAFIKDLFCESKVASRDKRQLGHDWACDVTAKVVHHRASRLIALSKVHRGASLPGQDWKRMRESSEDSNGRCRAVFGKSYGF